MREAYYENADQRAALVKQAEGQGEVMIHDDFNTGPNGENTLTFDFPQPDVPRIPTELQLLGQRIKETPEQVSTSDLVRYIGLKFEGAS